MNMSDLEPFGFYISAGYVDRWDGKRHVRVGEAQSDGSVAFTDAGRKMVDELLAKEYMATLTAPSDNEAEAQAAAEKARLEAEAARVEAEKAPATQPAPVPSMNSDVMDLLDEIKD
jgi:hypothetical protein